MSRWKQQKQQNHHLSFITYVYHLKHPQTTQRQLVRIGAGRSKRSKIWSGEILSVYHLPPQLTAPGSPRTHSVPANYHSKTWTSIALRPVLRLEIENVYCFLAETSIEQNGSSKAKLLRGQIARKTWTRVQGPGGKQSLGKIIREATNTRKRINSWSSKLPLNRRLRIDLKVRNYLPSFFVDLPMHGVHRVQDLVPSRDDPLWGGVYSIWPVSIVTVTRGAVTQPESGGKIRICDWLHKSMTWALFTFVCVAWHGSAWHGMD